MLNKFVSTSIIEDDSIGVVQGINGIGPIGRLRYALFIERDKKTYAHADASERTFVEPIDAHSLNFHYSSAAGCAAAVRVSWAEDALTDPHLKLVVEHSGVAPASFPQMVVTSRLAVRDTRIAKLKMLTMLREACVIGVLSGGRYACIGCRPDLAKLFKRMGLKQSAESFRDRVAGPMSVMILDLADHAYLFDSRSPFVNASDLYLAMQNEASLT